MVVSRHSVLLIGFDDDAALRIVSILGSFDVEFYRIPWMDGLSSFARDREFEAVLFSYPAQDPWLTLFLDELRRIDGASRHAGVVAVSPPGQVANAERLLGRGVNRVVALDESGDALREAVLLLLDVAQRLPVRAQVELKGVDAEGPTIAFCHTENLSLSGMLVSCSRRFPVGAPLDFALLLPGEPEPIRGQAQVARHTDPKRERVVGLGAAFQSFSESHRSRLRGILARHAVS